MSPVQLSRRAFSALLPAGLLTTVAVPSTGQTAPAPAPSTGSHARSKRLLADFLAGIGTGDIKRNLTRFCHADCRFEIFHPFNTIDGIDDAAERFFEPLRAAFPDGDYRPGFFLGGDYEGRELVSSWGYIQGTFDGPWLGIPPTNNLTFQSFGINGIVHNGKIAKAYILLDIVDVMRQAGHYPSLQSPGSTERWRFPPADTGATALTHDPVLGADTLRIVREMQTGLLSAAEIKALAGKNGRHSAHWHEKMNWYGAAGIGSARARQGYINFHGTLFVEAFPDRGEWPPVPDGPEDAPGHYLRLGDGDYAVTAGWPSLDGTHLGPEGLGLPPTGKKIELRVADWYRLDASRKIYDKWVMMDIPHALQQLGMDLFHDL
jgi:predicted ester cyclase